jgi:cytochrome P450
MQTPSRAMREPDEQPRDNAIDNGDQGAFLAPSLDGELARFWASETDAIQDLFPLLARLRVDSPVHRYGDLVFVSRYDDVKTVLTDRRRFSNEFMDDGAGRVQRLAASLSSDDRAKFSDLVELERMLTFHSDGAEHERRRRALHLLFTARRIAEFETVTQAYVEEVTRSIPTRRSTSHPPACSCHRGLSPTYLASRARTVAGWRGGWRRSRPTCTRHTVSRRPMRVPSISSRI